MRKTLLFYFFIVLITANAQRIVEKPDRGVVAVNKGNNQLFISWRFLATDPDDITFNVYRQIGIATPVKLNAQPVSGATNITWNVTGVGLNIASKIIVKPVISGVEGNEEGSWYLNAGHPVGRIVRDYTFQSFPSGYPVMSMKFCWVGDLEGDGQFDFVVDRHPGGIVESEGDSIIGSVPPVHLDAYNSNGTFKWRISMGYNVATSNGHNDMVTVYDMDGDNKAEVLMAVSEGTTFPDGTVIKNADGTIRNYNSVAGSAPQWIAIVNGETGNLIDTIPLLLADQIKTTRSDSWKHIGGHFIIQYLDGIRPSLVYQYKNRQSSGNFTGAYEAWTFTGGKLVRNWASLFFRESSGNEAHQVRAADVDGDGKDELVEIGYTVDDNGTLLYKVPDVGHGDRHCLADIDPDKPGLEHFFIQQSNILGMGINDAATGKIIKPIYLSSVADVGRGICAAFDPTKRGMQFYSTMSGNAMYDAKGKLITGAKGSFPAEALWWGSDLYRWEVDAVGDDKNPVLESYSTSGLSIGRSVNLYKGTEIGSSDYYIAAPNGGRAAFWGDILGDWREELIYSRRNNTGFVILSTWDATTKRQYCLMQNPAYRCQTTAKGYYQTPDVDFYMAADMPKPPVPPIQSADVYLTSENSITTAHNNKSLMLDIRNSNVNISLNEEVALSRLWLMNPKAKNYTISGSGKFTGNMDVVKSLQGDVVLSGNHDYTGKTQISEGRLFLNGSIASPVQVDARGILGGNANLQGGVTLETGLNVEGGRLEPGNGAIPGNMTIVGNLLLPGRNNIAFDIDQSKTQACDLLNIQGNFNVVGTNHSIIIKSGQTLNPGIYTLINYTGNSNATKSNFKVRGLEGIPYSLILEPNVIKIEIEQSRQSAFVVWKGNQSANWDFETKNFLQGTLADIFVPGDSVIFNDDVTAKNILLNESMPVKGLIFNNQTDYKISGDGIIAGEAKLLKTGSGKISLLTEENTFSGGVDFSDGILEVASLKDGGLPSSIGSASNIATNWIMRNATLQTASQMATNRSMKVYGKLTVNNPTTNNSVMITGNISGENISLEVNGAGTLGLQGSNSFTSVLLKNGVLSMGSVEANSYSLGNAVITLEGGTLQMRDANSTSTVGPWRNTIIVPEGKTGRWNLPMRWNFTNQLSGKGTLYLNIPYVRSDFQGDWSMFEGTLKIVTGGSGDFRINNTTGYGKANIDLASGINVYALSTGRTIKIGALSGVAGSNVSGNSTTWQIGTNNVSDMTFGGVISGTGSMVYKEGTGNWTLSGANTYTGFTRINGGRLIVTNTTGSATGTGSVMIADGGTLSGTGIISGTTAVYKGGTLAPGLVNGIGTLKFGADLNMVSGSKVIIRISASNNDKLSVTGKVALNGTLELQAQNTSFTLGKSYTLFTAASSTGTFEAISPEKPAEGLKWNISRINEGIISVDQESAVSTPESAGVKIYPNIVTDYCKIEFSEHGKSYNICIFDQFGREVKTVLTSDKIESVNLNDLTSGIYFVRISGSDMPVSIGRIIKK